MTLAEALTRWLWRLQLMAMACPVDGYGVSTAERIS
jgi:hypothetical protein